MGYEQMVEIVKANGWVLKVFGQTTKWVNPKRNDGAAYVDRESSLRYIIEDYNLNQ